MLDLETALITFASAAALAAVHVAAGTLHSPRDGRRSPWLSAGAGVAVAYVFVHILPELREGQRAIEEEGGDVLGAFEHHVFLVALAGLLTFSGVEHAVLQRRPGGRGGEKAADIHVFWAHVGVFAAYNGLIGFLVVHREEGYGIDLLIFTVAIGVHFLVNDYGLEEHHRHRYRRKGRWILSGAVLAGWTVALFVELSRPAIELIFAFVAGAIVLNVLKEELPDQRQSRFAPFLGGCAVYTAFLLLLP
jgi:zinc transporter ZupT